MPGAPVPLTGQAFVAQRRGSTAKRATELLFIAFKQLILNNLFSGKRQLDALFAQEMYRIERRETDAFQAPAARDRRAAREQKWPRTEARGHFHNQEAGGVWELLPLAGLKPHAG